MVPFSGVLLLVVLVPILAGVVALAQGKRRLGAVLLGVGALPIVLALLAAFLTTWRGTYFGDPKDPLAGVYKTPVPAAVRVVNFRGETFGMDPSFWWECAPLDESYLTALQKNAKLTRATEKNPLPSLGRSWPSWWNAARVYALPEAYFNDSGDGGIQRVYVDRKNNRAFLCFLGY